MQIQFTMNSVLLKNYLLRKKLVKSSLIIIISILSFNIVFAQNEFTQKDREFLIELRVTMEQLKVTIEQMEKRIDERFIQLDKRIDERFVQIDKRIDTGYTFMLWGFGILFGGIGLLIGLVVSDRKIASKPAEKKLYSSTKREKLLETILKEFAKEQPKLADILKTHRL